MSESFKSEETRGVRFQKEGTEVNKEYVEGFSNLPKLSRTPNTTLTGIPGEFDEPGGEGDQRVKTVKTELEGEKQKKKNL